MNPLSTTLNKIREHSPCQEGWTKLLATLGKTKADDEPVLFETILDSNGLDDALWCLRTLDHEHQRTCRLFAVWCSREVQHLMTDPRSIAALDVAEAHANGTATDQELASAWDAAWAAALASAGDAARAAALAAARAAELDAAGDAAWAAARAAALAAAWDAAWDAQSAKFREIFRAGEFV
jgi:hypothetical protein